MTTLGGPNYDNLLVATNDNGLIDYSFIDMTTSKSGSKLVQTLDSGLININLLPTSTTGANNKIPITTSGNVLSNTWLNTTNGTGTLAAGKVVVTGSDKLISNNLLNTTDGSTTTESANSSKVVKTTTNGKINDNLLKTTKSGGSANANTIVKLDSNGLLDPSLFRNDQFIPLTGGEPSGNILVTGPNNRIDNTLDNLKTKYPNFYGFGSNAYTDGFLIGMNYTGSTNSEKDGSGYLVIATHDNGTEPIYVRQYTGYQGYTNMPDNVAHEITLMDKDGYTNVNKLVSSGDIITTNATKTSGNLTIAGIGESSIAGTLKVAKGIIIPVTGDKVSSTSSYGTAPLTIGGNNNLRIEIDENEILAKNASNKPSGVGDTDGALHLQAEGGLVKIGQRSKANLHVNGNISTMNYNSDPGNNEASSGNLTVVGTSYLKNTEVGNSSTKSSLKVYGTGYFYNTTDTSGTANNKPALIIGGTDTTAHIEIDNNEIQAKASGTTTGTLGINIDGGNVSIGNDAANSVVTLRKNTSVTGTLSVAGNTTIGSTNTKSTLKVFGGVTADNGLTVNNAILTANKGLTVNNEVLTATKGLVITSGNNVVSTSYNNPHLTIGSSTGTHLEIDNNEIAAKSNASTVSTLYLQDGGGGVTIGGGEGEAVLRINGTTTSSGLITANGGIHIPISGDKVPGSVGSVPLVIGKTSGEHIQIDENEIQKMASASTPGVLYLNDYGGTVTIGSDTHTAGLSVHGTVVINNSGTLNMRPQDGSEHVVLRISRTGGHGGGGDDVLLTGGGNMTAIFSGDAYADWYNYVNTNSIATIESDGLWPVKSVTENNAVNKYVVGVGNGKGGYSDSLYLLSDKSVYIQTCIHATENQPIGYKNRKNFIFDESGNLTVPGYIKAMNGTTTSTTLAPMPTTSSGVGQVILISNATFTLPNGGTWFVWFYRSRYDSDYQDGMNAYNPYVNDDPNQKLNGKLIWPGGTKFNALSGQNASNGFAWRIQ